MLQVDTKTEFHHKISISPSVFESLFNSDFINDLDSEFDVHAQIQMGASGAQIIIEGTTQGDIDHAKEAIEILDRQESSVTQYRKVFTRVKKGQEILVSYPESVGQKNPKFKKEPKTLCWKGFSPAKSKLAKISKMLGLVVKKEEDGFIDIRLLELDTGETGKESHQKQVIRLNTALEILQVIVEDRSLNIKYLESQLKEKINKTPELVKQHKVKEEEKAIAENGVRETMNRAALLKQPSLHIRRVDKPDISIVSFGKNGISVPQEMFLNLIQREFRVEIEVRQGKDDVDVFIGARSEGANPRGAIDILSTFLKKKLPQTEEEFIREINPLVAVRDRYEDGHEIQAEFISIGAIPVSILSDYTQAFATEIHKDDERYYIFGDSETSVNRMAYTLKQLQNQFAQNEYNANTKEAQRLLRQRSEFYQNILHQARNDKRTADRKITALKSRISELNDDKKPLKQDALTKVQGDLAISEGKLKDITAKIDCITPYSDAVSVLLTKVQNIAKEKTFSKQSTGKIQELSKIIRSVLAQQNGEKIFETIDGSLNSLQNAMNEQAKLKGKDTKKLTDLDREKLAYNYEAIRSNLSDYKKTATEILDKIKTGINPDETMSAYDELISVHSKLDKYLKDSKSDIRLKSYQTHKSRPHKGLLKTSEKNSLILRAKKEYPTSVTDTKQPKNRKVVKQEHQGDRNKEEAIAVKINRSIQAFKKKARTPEVRVYHSGLGIDLSELARFLSEDKSQNVAKAIFESELGIWLEPEYVDRSDAWGLKIYEAQKLSETRMNVRDSLLYDISLLAGSSNAKSLSASYVSNLIRSKFTESKQKNDFKKEAHGFFVNPAVHDFFNSLNREENLSVFEEKSGMRLQLAVNSEGYKGFNLCLSNETQHPNLETVTDIGRVLEVIEERLFRMQTSKKIQAPSNDEIRGWLNNPKGAHNGIRASSSIVTGFESASNGSGAQSLKSKNSVDDNAVAIPKLSEKHLDIIRNIPEPKPFVPLRRKGLLDGEKSSQEKLWTCFENSSVSFALGPAATGKTYTSIRYLIGMLKEGHINRIIVGRPAVEAGERLGFLPGDAKDKVDPYMQPIYDSFYEILGHGDMVEGEKTLNELIKNKIVEISPLGFMRGRTFKKSGIYIDEAQNATYMQLKTILTRLGQESTMIFGGDESQDDLRDFGSVSGLLPISELFSGTKGFGVVHMDPEDATARHELLTSMVRMFNTHEEGLDSLTLGGLKFEELIAYQSTIDDSRNDPTNNFLKLRSDIAKQAINTAIRKGSNDERDAFSEALKLKENGEVESPPQQGKTPKPNGLTM